MYEMQVTAGAATNIVIPGRWKSGSVLPKKTLWRVIVEKTMPRKNEMENHSQAISLLHFGG